MKYIIHATIDPDTGTELESNPQQMQELVGTWQAKNPIGMYFSLTERAMTIVLEADNEDSFFEALHKTWTVAGTYPEVWPVADVSEFPALLKRLGIGG